MYVFGLNQEQLYLFLIDLIEFSKWGQITRIYMLDYLLSPSMTKGQARMARD